MPPASKFISANSQRLHLVQWSDQGPTLLFVHHILGDCTAWDAVASVLAADFTVSAVDLRGHGRSSKPETGYRWREDLAVDLAAVIEQTQTAPVILVGHSLGSMVSAAVAADFPHLVRGLVLEDPPAFGQKSAFGFFAKRLAIRQMAPADRVKHFLASGRDEQQSSRSSDWYERFAPGILSELLEGRAAFEADRCFPAITCPVLLFFGDPGKGSVVSRPHRAAICALLEKARVTTSEWPDAGHGIHETDPVRFACDVKTFVQHDAPALPHA